MRPEAKERARAYIASGKTPRAIAGQGGDKTTYAVACTIAVDFGLDDASVAELLAEYNRSKCEPRWAERDLERFLRSARKCANGKPGEVGKLLNVDRADYTGPSSPANIPAKSTAPSPPKSSATSGQPKYGAARTARTPFFEVRRAGEGRSCVRARTLRTALFISVPSLKKEEQTNREQNGGVMPSVASVDGAISQPSEPSAKVSESSATHSEPSDTSAPVYRAQPPSLVTGNRDGLQGDMLRIYDGLLRRGPMRRDRIVHALKWTEERFSTAEKWLTDGGWIVVNNPKGNT